MASPALGMARLHAGGHSTPTSPGVRGAGPRVPTLLSTRTAFLWVGSGSATVARHLSERTEVTPGGEKPWDKWPHTRVGEMRLRPLRTSSLAWRQRHLSRPFCVLRSLPRRVRAPHLLSPYLMAPQDAAYDPRVSSGTRPPATGTEATCSLQPPHVTQLLQDQAQLRGTAQRPCQHRGGRPEGTE